MTYPTSRLGAKIELVDLAREIEKADETIGLVVSGKLDVIREQMRALQEQARRLLRRGPRRLAPPPRDVQFQEDAWQGLSPLPS